MRRRGKGEASFLRCKSPGREEPHVTNRGRRMEGEKEAKRDIKEGKTVTEGERGKLRWGRRKCGKEEDRNREGNKKKTRGAERGGRGDTGH